MELELSWPVNVQQHAHWPIGLLELPSGTQILADAVTPQLLDHLKFYASVLGHRFLVVCVNKTRHKRWTLKVGLLVSVQPSSD